MIITISGKPGSGKSAVAKLLAKKLGLKHYSTGDFMRQMAEERKISLLELSKIAETDRSIDEELDQWQIDIGKHEDNFVIDARLGFHFIPHSIKIYLTAQLNTRASRILSDRIRNEKNINLEKTVDNIKKRENSEKKRYREYYKLDPNNEEQYDLVVDTTQITPEQAVEEIIGFLKRKI